MVTQPKILIVEDDLDVAEMVSAYFRVQEYDVKTVNWGKEALQAFQNVRPDLIILDIRLPDIDGYEIARRVRSNRRMQDIPIIFLTDKRSRADRLQGLELGADDYITKPFDIQELRLRVRNALNRARQGTLVNPVSGLPEGTVVDEHLAHSIKEKMWATLLVSLVNLDEFRESYGFVASDDILRAFSLMIKNTANEFSSGNFFIGHINLTDLIIVADHPGITRALSEKIRTRLEQSLNYFYPIKDRGKGIHKSKRLGIRIGLLDTSQGLFTDVDHLKTSLLQNRS